MFQTSNPKKFIEFLLYLANFKKINIYQSTKPGKKYNVFRVDYDFDRCEIFDFNKRRLVKDISKEIEQEVNFEYIANENLNGSDIYWMPNISKYGGREPKAPEITHARALFVDIDIPLTSEEIDSRLNSNNLPTPTFQFQTVKGWQIYWIFNKSLLLRQMDRKNWALRNTKNIQLYSLVTKKLMSIFSSDTTAINLNRKMRVPNTFRWKGESRSFYCEDIITGTKPLYRFSDFISLVSGDGIVIKPVVSNKIIPNVPDKIDLSQPITMIEFNSLVDDFDFRNDLNIPSTDVFCCFRPANHKNKDAKPSAAYKFYKGKWVYICHCLAKPLDFRDCLHMFNGLSDKAIFEYLKNLFGVGSIVGEDEKSSLENLNGTFEDFQECLNRYSEREDFPLLSSRWIVGYRLVTSIFYNEAKESLSRGKATFTLSTNQLAKLSGLNKMQTVGITNIFCYLGLLKKSINPTIKKFNRGISEFEILNIDKNQVALKLEALLSSNLKNAKNFNRGWVLKNLGEQTAEDIYLEASPDGARQVGEEAKQERTTAMLKVAQ